MSEAILKALESLDPKNDEHWTNDGLPRVDVVANISGVKDLRRDDLTKLAPELTRAALSLAPDTSVDPDAEPVFDRDKAVADQQELANAMTAKRAEINRATRELQALQAQHDELTMLLDPGPKSHLQNQENIMHFLRSQHEQRVQRASVQRVAIGALQGAKLDARSPLDQAFGRKNTRGAVPPTRRQAAI